MNYLPLRLLDRSMSRRSWFVPIAGPRPGRISDAGDGSQKLKKLQPNSSTLSNIYLLCQQRCRHLRQSPPFKCIMKVVLTQVMPFLKPEQYLEIERAAETRSEYL